MSDPVASLTVPLGCDVRAELPLQWIDDHTGIYAFVPLGQVDWVRAAATTLLEKVDDALDGDGVDIILTPEAKAITLAYELCVRLNLREFVVARKSQKSYMVNPVSVPVSSITALAQEQLWFGQAEIDKLRGRHILIVDDVISTGATMNALLGFLKSIECTVALIACVLTEGEERTEVAGVPVAHIAHIPLAER
ncbi:MAG: adenine phosphoribosyltransferase [Actinomycetia bacterium]|nr:adenine phosphoribosyltransferase [Actinomycetes bacterium]